MTDPVVPVSPSAPVPQPAKPKAGGKQGESPLDVLDQILNEAQDKMEDDTKKKEEEEVKKMEAEREQQKIKDQLQVQQQIEELKTVTESPEYHARVEQHDTEVQAQSQRAEEMAGTEIRQLGHMKVDVPAE